MIENKYFYPRCSNSGLLISNTFISTMLGITKQNSNYVIKKFNLDKIEDSNSYLYKFSQFNEHYKNQFKYNIPDHQLKNMFDLYIVIDEKLKNGNKI